MRHEGTRLAGSPGVAADREPEHADQLADVLSALRGASVGVAGADRRLASLLEVGCGAVDAAAGCVVAVRGSRAPTVLTVVDPDCLVDWKAGVELVDATVERAIDSGQTIAQLGSPGVRPLVAVPIWSAGAIAGALVLLGGVERRVFSALDLALVDLVAGELGRAFERDQATDGRPAAVLAWEAVGDRVALLDGQGGEKLGGGITRPFDPARDLRRPGDPVPDSVEPAVREAIGHLRATGTPSTRVFTVGEGQDARAAEARFATLPSGELVCIVREVSDRQRMDGVLGEQVAFASLLRSISTRLLLTDAEDLDAGIGRALRELASFTGAASATVYEADLGIARLHRTHRWSEPRVEEEPALLEGAATAWLLGRLASSDHLALSATAGAGAPPGVAPGGADGPMLWLRLGTSASGDGAAGADGCLLLRWRPGRAAPTPTAAALLPNAAFLFSGALRRRRAASLSDAYAQVFEGIARDEPLDRALQAVAGLVARHTLGAEVVLLTVSDGRFRMASGDERWAAWFAEQPLALTSPYGQAVVTGQPVLVVDVGHDHRFDAGNVPEKRFSALQVIPVAPSVHARTGAVIVVLGTAAAAVAVEGPVRSAATSLVAVALERDEDHRRLAHQATHDPLTGVGNRAALVQGLEDALAAGRSSGRRVAVLFADLDGFKQINDQYGHDHGDRLLVEVARRIRGAVRSGDLVARAGGDEFVVVCADLDSTDQAAMIAESVHAAIEDEPIELGDLALPMTMSVGVALADPVLDDADRLLRVADLAMYEAKGRGGRLDGERGSDPSGRSRFTVDLVRAISGGDLEIHQQPIISFDDRLVGVEVLLRWPNAPHRVVGPARVARAAAEAGYAAALGRWVRRQALAERAAWPTVGDGEVDPPPVHVNVAAADLLSVGFIVGLLDDLADAGVGPSAMALEVQATDLRRTDVREVVVELADHGVPILVEGLNGSALSITDLVHLPLRGVRLGAQVAAGLATDRSVRAIAEALVTLCSGIGWTSHLVGVEDEEQRSWAEEIGFDAVQGWLIGEPLPAADFAPWLARRRPALG